MLDIIKEMLAKHNIDLVGTVPMSRCNTVRPHKLQGLGFEGDRHLYVIVFAIPYYTEQYARNISAYAVSRDYHLFAKQLFDSIIPELHQKFPKNRFFGFADNSPISEVPAAAMAGLGIIGDNMMLITEKYSSYVFLGEIITDLELPNDKDYTIRQCEHCGKCRSACPMSEIGQCLSALTQKKGELDEKEKEYLIKYNTAWGCDICQETCPHTKKAIDNGPLYSPIEFFSQCVTPYLTSQDVRLMSDEQFSNRAYSWRGRNTIIRNLEIIENA